MNIQLAYRHKMIFFFFYTHLQHVSFSRYTQWYLNIDHALTLARLKYPALISSYEQTANWMDQFWRCDLPHLFCLVSFVFLSKDCHLQHCDFYLFLCCGLFTKVMQKSCLKAFSNLHMMVVHFKNVTWYENLK